MAESPVIGIRFPRDLLERVDSLVGVEGESRSQVVLTLVKRSLDSEGIQDIPQASTDLAALESRLTAVEQKIRESFNSRFTELSQELDSVRQTLDAVQQELNAVKQSNLTHRTEPVRPALAREQPQDVDLTEGLSQTELCDRFGISGTNLVKIARNAGMTTHEYLTRKTGWQWRNVRSSRSKKGLWFPPTDDPADDGEK